MYIGCKRGTMIIFFRPEGHPNPRYHRCGLADVEWFGIACNFAALSVGMLGRE